MGKGRRLQVEFTQRDRRGIEAVAGRIATSADDIARALALHRMDPGQSTPVVGINLGLSAKAVWQIGKRYLDGGLERALFDAPRPDKAPAPDQRQQQPIVAVACSPHPVGRAR